MQRDINQLAPMAWSSKQHMAQHFPRSTVTAADFRDYIIKKWSLRLTCVAV